MNKFLVDSDVLLNAVLEGERQEASVEFLDQHEEYICTTILNIMEISSVLSRKYRWKGKDIRDVVSTIERGTDVLIPSETEIIEAYELVYHHFFSAIDAILLTLSKGQDQILITFDLELLNRGSKHTKVNKPEDWID